MARNNTLIFLTGYMGAGKSTIGRKLAREIRYRFMDTDKVLEKQFGKTMSLIFSEDGERAFRKAEEVLIEKCTYRNRTVVSTGGGTLTRMETFYTAQRHGLLIYLKAPVEVLYERIVFSAKDRPLLNLENTEEQFRKRFALREPYYTKADFQIETTRRHADEVVKDIVQWLREYQSNSPS